MRSYTLPDVAELLGVSIEDVDYLIEEDKIPVCIRLPECRAYPDKKSRQEVTIVPGLYRIDPIGAKSLLAAKNKENPKGYLIQCQPEPSVDNQIIFYFDSPEFPSLSPAPLVSYYDLRVSENALILYKTKTKSTLTESGKESLELNEDKDSEPGEKEHPYLHKIIKLVFEDENKNCHRMPKYKEMRKLFEDGIYEKYKEPGYLHQIIGSVFNSEYKKSGKIPSFKTMRTLFENNLYKNFDEDDCIQEVTDEGIYWLDPTKGKEYNPMSWKRFKNYLSELRKPLKRSPSS